MASWKEGDVLAVLEEAASDERVLRVFAVAMRDAWLCRRWNALRGEAAPMTVDSVAEVLALEFHLGPERVKQIYYGRPRH